MCVVRTACMLDILLRVCYYMPMVREIVKVRKVAGSMVITIPQTVLDEVRIAEGDRVLVEAFLPGRIFIVKEHKQMPSTRRAELELEILESRRNLLDSEITHINAQHDANMPAEPGMENPSVVAVRRRELETSRDQVTLEIAEKRLQLFELEGGANPEDPDRLRSDTESLCCELERHLDEFNDLHLSFAEIQKLYYTRYPSKPRALAEAILHFVPDDDH